MRPRLPSFPRYTKGSINGTQHRANPPGRRRLGIERLEDRSLLSTWTLLIYMNADNNLSTDAISDINEMEKVDYGPSVKILVLVDYLAEENNTYRGLVRHDTDPSQVTSPFINIGEYDMGERDNLKNFLNWGVSSYPADH